MNTKSFCKAALLFLLSTVSLFSLDMKNYGLGLSETILSNNILWGFNRYVQQADYGMISLDSITINLTNPWVWDQDEFIVNHVGHPYQGSVYYSAGRSAGNDFWASATMTVLGSLTWELFMETETPSINDIIVTTFGGITSGEMLFRLSEAVLYGYDGSHSPGLFRSVGASLLSPFSGINEYFLPKDRIEYVKIDGYHTFGMGYSSFNVRYGLLDEVQYSQSGSDLCYTLSLTYGDAITNKNKTPYDYFTFDAEILLSYDNESFVNFSSEGLLYGKFWFHEKNNMSLGAYLNYDFVYNRIINLGANGIGAGWQIEQELGPHWDLSMALYGNFIFMGASDIIFLKYNDLYVSSPDYERRNYSLCVGDNAKLNLTLSRKYSLFITLQYHLYNLFIIDSSVPEDGASGKELVGTGVLSCRQNLDENLFIGIRGSFYHKESFYDNYSDLHESLVDFTVYYGFNF